MAAGPIRQHPSETNAIVESLGGCFCVTQESGDLSELTYRDTRVAQGEAKIDRLLEQITTTREMAQGFQRLLEAGHCLAVGRARARHETGLPQVLKRFLP
jgi:hypothetical protein